MISFFYNTWTDWVRLVLLAFDFLAIGLMYVRFRQHYPTWNRKTLDIKLALLLWVLTSAAALVQNMYEDQPIGPKTILSALAAAITIRGVYSHGEWGGYD